MSGSIWGVEVSRSVLLVAGFGVYEDLAHTHRCRPCCGGDLQHHHRPGGVRPAVLQTVQCLFLAVPSCNDIFVQMSFQLLLWDQPTRILRTRCVWVRSVWRDMCVMCYGMRFRGYFGLTYVTRFFPARLKCFGSCVREHSDLKRVCVTATKRPQFILLYYPDACCVHHEHGRWAS